MMDVDFDDDMVLQWFGRKKRAVMKGGDDEDDALRVSVKTASG